MEQIYGNIKLYIVENYDEMSKMGAEIIKNQLLSKPNTVLGLATGSTPLGAYSQLINMYNNGDISFEEVKTFNLDEYYPINKKDSQSYDYFMRENFFNHINIKLENINIPNGEASNADKECADYEVGIKKAGGIDLQLLGIGVNGHIGFNEPDSYFYGSTHCVDLTESTIIANSRFFASPDEVPKQALSMGIRTIMNSKKILLLASGENKADVMYEIIHGKIQPQVPASVLQLHNDVIIVIDNAAARRI